MNDNDIGRLTVKSSPIARSVSMLKNLAVTICVSDIGRVNNISIVFDRFSSAIILIEKAGTKITMNQAVTLKNDCIDADPMANKSLTKKKLAKAANKTNIM